MFLFGPVRGLNFVYSSHLTFCIKWYFSIFHCSTLLWLDFISRHPIIECLHSFDWICKASKWIVCKIKILRSLGLKGDIISSSESEIIRQSGLVTLLLIKKPLTLTSYSFKLLWRLTQSLLTSLTQQQLTWQITLMPV